MEEKEEVYKGKIDELVGKIKIIKDEKIPDWEKSDKIMELLRLQYLFVHTNYLNKKKTEEKFATLNFKEEGIKLTLNKDDKDVFEYHVIYGNSFGPFNPKAYFDCDIKILWLLKESYIDGIGCWIGDNEDKKPDRGGHDQAKEYNKWEEIVHYTKKRIVKITKKILSIIDEKGNWEKDSEETYQKVMDHICILEVQHFPGLNFSGVETDDGKFWTWVKLNYELLCELIDFYKPNIVIGERFSLGAALIRNNEKDITIQSWSKLKKLGKLENKDDFFNWLYAHKLHEQSELYFIGKRKINKNKQDKEKIRNEERIFDFRNYCNLVKDEEGCLWIGWYHPVASRYGEWKDYVIDNLAKFIKRNL